MNIKKKFSLEKEIYSQENILTAIEDFTDVCSIIFYEDNYSVEIEANEEEINTLFHEFMNYVISL